ncbi:MAG: peptide ABC transporter substrate-binding protein, partial [Enterococcus sp.]
MRKGKLGLIGALTVCGIVLGACSTGEGTSDSTSEAATQAYNVVIPAEAGSIDLSLASDSYSFNILNNVN